MERPLPPLGERGRETCGGATVRDRARGSCKERAPSGQNRPVWGSRRALRGLALGRAGSPCSGFCTELFSQTNGWREGVALKRCLEGRSRGKEPLEKGGQEWRGDLDGAHHERRTEAPTRPSKARPRRQASGTPSAPAHRVLRHTEASTRAGSQPRRA